jgi:formylglycine-generating enzyme required for sulfatase activity
MGINDKDVPGLQKIFEIDRRELFRDEVPAHEVTIDSFYLDRSLVTNAQFSSFVKAYPFWRREPLPNKLQNEHYLEHWMANEYPPQLANHPVVNVSWYAAVAYCQAQGKRLPTEAEWEFAARGGQAGHFPWGDQMPDKSRANYSASGVGTTTVVGSYAANGYGLYDMAGNVWEYLADEWGAYVSAAQRNPVRGDDRFDGGDVFLKVKTRRVIRGGSWGGAPVNLWVGYRDSHPPENGKGFLGFRCAKSAAK